MTVTPAQYNLTIYQGADFSQLFTFLQESGGDPVDLTNFSARMQIRQRVNAASPIIELTSANGRIVLGGTAGTVTLTLNATETAQLPDTQGVYDLEIVAGENNADRYLEGTVTIKPEVTR